MTGWLSSPIVFTFNMIYKVIHTKVGRLCHSIWRWVHGSWTDECQDLYSNFSRMLNLKIKLLQRAFFLWLATIWPCLMLSEVTLELKLFPVQPFSAWAGLLSGTSIAVLCICLGNVQMHHMVGERRQWRKKKVGKKCNVQQAPAVTHPAGEFFSFFNY